MSATVTVSSRVLRDNAKRFANIVTVLIFNFLCISPGVINVLVTTPLWVVNTRLKLQGSKFRNADIHTTNYSGILGK